MKSTYKHYINQCLCETFNVNLPWVIKYSVACKLIIRGLIYKHQYLLIFLSSLEVPWFCLTRGYCKREIRNSVNKIANEDSSKL